MYTIIACLLGTSSATGFELVEQNERGEWVPVVLSRPIPQIDPFSPTSVFMGSAEYRKEIEQMPSANQLIFWENQIARLARKAFDTGTILNTSRVEEWAQASGLNRSTINSIVLSEFARSQLSVSGDENRFNQNQSVLAGFGLVSETPRKVFDQLATSGFNDAFKSIPLHQKLKLLESFPQDIRDHVVVETYALAEHRNNPRLIDWLSTNVSANVKEILALRELRGCLITDSNTECNFRILNMANPQSMSLRSQCNLVTEVQMLATVSNHNPSARIKERVQNLLNLLPSEIQCLSNEGQLKALQPAGALNEFNKVAQSTIPTNGPSSRSVPTRRVVGCEIESAGSMRRRAELLTHALALFESGHVQSSGGFQSDRPSCVVWMTTRKSKSGVITVESKGMGPGFTKVFDPLQFNNNEELKNFVSSLLKDARSAHNVSNAKPVSNAPASNVKGKAPTTVH